MIEKLELENFRSHKKTELRFSEGTNILIGISGSGKSSVLDGICFALYGNTPKLQARKLKVSDLIMDKPTKEEEATIKLTFSADGKTYEVIRTIYREKSTYAELREDGALKATSTTLVTEAIERILKANFDLFSKIIYAEQNQMDYFLAVPKGDRMAKIDELLKLQRFEDARHIAVSFSNKLKFKAKNLQEAVEKFNEAELNSKREVLGKELWETEVLVSELGKRNEALAGVLQTLGKQLEEKEKSRQEIERLRGIRKESEGVIKLLDDEIKEIPTGDIVKVRLDFDRKRKDFEEKSKAEENRRKDLAIVESELREKRKDLDEKRKALEFLKGFDSKKAEETEKALNAKKEDVMKKDISVKDLFNSIRSLKTKTAEQKCPTCDTPLTSEKRLKLLQEKEKEFERLNGEIRDLSSEALTLQKEAEKEKANLKQADYFRQRLEQLGLVEKEIEIREKRKKELESRRIDLEGIRKEFEDSRKSKESLELREAKFEKLKNYHLNLVEIDKKLKHIQFDELDYEKIKQDIENKMREKIALEKDFQYKQELLDEKRKSLAMVMESLDFIEKNRTEINYLKYSTETLENFAEVLSEVQAKLREEFVLTLNDVMNEVWGELYPYEDYSAIRFRIEESDYTLQLCDLKNNWVNVEGISSGGERAIASFVMRVALSIVLAPNLKLLILDEPTHNLDAETIDKLTEVLKTKLTDLIDQIFIVTHDERLVQAGTAYIYELRREAKKKEPTQVHRIETFLSS